MNIQKWKRSSIVPQSLTVREIPRKAVTPQDEAKQRESVHVYIRQNVIMPDELKLIIFGGFVAIMSWSMLTIYVASFSKPDVIIIDSSTGQVLP